MNYHDHPNCNTVLRAPEGWDKDNPNLPCDTLPVTLEYYQDGVKSHPVVISYWRPTLEELEILTTGGCVTLTILGRSMPPVIVGVTA